MYVNTMLMLDYFTILCTAMFYENVPISLNENIIRSYACVCINIIIKIYSQTLIATKIHYIRSTLDTRAVQYEHFRRP